MTLVGINHRANKQQQLQYLGKQPHQPFIILLSSQRIPTSLLHSLALSQNTTPPVLQHTEITTIPPHHENTPLPTIVLGLTNCRTIAAKILIVLQFQYDNDSGNQHLVITNSHQQYSAYMDHEYVRSIFTIKSEIHTQYFTVIS